MKIIGVDFDDVLMNFNESLTHYYNSKKGTSYTRNDITDYELGKSWNCSMEEAIEYVTNFYHSDEHYETTPIAGALESIERLSQDCQLVIITSRPQLVKDQTERWLQRHFPNKFHAVHFVNSHFGDLKKPKSKADVCIQLGVDFLIDDSYHNAKDVASKGIKVLLLDAPWNQIQHDNENIRRVYSWQEIISNIYNS